jgi:hypothetical protein
LSAELTTVMTDSGMLGERLNSATSLRARSAFIIPAPCTLSWSTVKPLLQRARISAVFHPSPRPALSLAEGAVSPSARPAGESAAALSANVPVTRLPTWYALLRMRPLSISYAEGFLVLSSSVDATFIWMKRSHYR